MTKQKDSMIWTDSLLLTYAHYIICFVLGVTGQITVTIIYQIIMIGLFIGTLYLESVKVKKEELPILLPWEPEIVER